MASVVDCLQPYYFHTHLVGSEGSLLDNKSDSAQAGRADQEQVEHAGDAPGGLGRREDHPYQPQFQAFVDCARRPARRCRSPISTRPWKPTASSSPPTARPPRAAR